MRSLGTLATWPVVTAAAVVVAVPEHAPGAAPVAIAGWGDIDRRFSWASITKLCASLAVLVAVEEGTVTLEDPAGPPGATVAHLLAHASGLSPGGGSVLAAPGTRRIYSNAGFDLLGDLVTARSEIPFDRYLAEAVAEPARLHHARLPPGGSPAVAMYGTTRDLAALGAELLCPRVVHADTLAAATTVAFPGLAGVLPGFGPQDPCDWGLGFELRDAKYPHWTGRTNSPSTFGHFGRSGGFLWVDPVAKVACAVLTDTAFGPWAHDAWPALSDAVLAELGRATAP